MRGHAALFAALLVAATLSAQETAPPKPDYSRDTIMKLFMNADPDEHPIRYRGYENFGSVQFHALGTTFHLNYLPFLMPLSGTGFGMSATSQTFPDPFVLTNTQIATSQRAWRTRRNLKAEMRRIEKSERARIKVTN
jgi:hypothetical protein